MAFTSDEQQRTELAARIQRADLDEQPTEIESPEQVDDAITFRIEYGEASLRVQDVAAPDDVQPLVTWPPRRSRAAAQP